MSRPELNEAQPTRPLSTYEEAESSLLQTLEYLSISLSSPDIPAQPPPAENPAPEKRTPYQAGSDPRRSYVLPRIEDEFPQSQSIPDRTPPAAFASCLGLVPLAIKGTYAWHKDTPGFIICSRCYVDHIHKSRFRSEFETQFFDDGKPRTCKFSQPKMKKDLFPSALKSGNSAQVAEWMRRRSQIPDCVGIQGAKGGQGLKWYKPRGDDIPGLVCCEACYEDHVTAASFSSRFEPIPPELHSPEHTWACDFALRYVAELYPKKADANDWATFAAEAKGRLNFDHCPGTQGRGTYRKLWFVSKNGPEGLAICAACWADNVLLTTEEDRWRQATEWWDEAGRSVKCSLGQLKIKLSMAQAHELKDYSIFWRAIGKLAQSPPCADQGITHGEWYTVPSDPEGFGICKACYVGICEPLNIGHLFKPKLDNPRDVALLCSLNASCGRFPQFLGQLLETYFTVDIASFDKFASTWASIPPCKRDEDVANRHWYGWFDCTICRECYHTFAHKYYSMASRMELKDKFMSHNVLCEMYSPRMRKIFEETAAADPIDLKPMLEFSLRRRQVYVETMPQARMILFQAQMNSQKQVVLNAQSNFHHTMGLQDDLFYGSTHTWSAAGVGSGFANRDLLLAEQYKQQAMGIVSGMPTATMQVGMLEQKWRAVE